MLNWPPLLVISSLCVLALGCAQWSQSLSSVLPNQGRQYAQELSSARLVEQSGQMLQARQRYEKLLQRHPQQPEAYQRLGVMCQMQGENDRAIQLLEQAHQLQPDDAKVLNDLGYALYMQGNYKRAVSVLKQAQAIQPDNPRVAANLAVALAVSGDVDSAYTLLRTSKGESHAAAGVGFALAQAGQTASAQRYFSRALIANPENRAAAEGLLQLARTTETSSNSAAEAHSAMTGVTAPFVGRNFVAAPQYRTGTEITPSYHSAGNAESGAAPKNKSFATASMTVDMNQRESLDQIVNHPLVKPNSPLDVAQTLEYPQTKGLPSVSAVGANDVVTNNPSDSAAKPRLRSDVVAITAASRGVMPAVIAGSSEALKRTEQLTESRQPEVVESSSATESTISLVSSEIEPADIRETLVDVDIWTSAETVWKSAASGTDWSPVEISKRPVLPTSHRSPMDKPQTPSLLPQFYWIAASSDSMTEESAAAHKPVPRIGNTSDLNEGPMTSVMSTPPPMTTGDEVMIRREGDWKAHLIADYGALPAHQRLDLWRHPRLDAQKAVCLFPVTDGIERVEASIALARLLGWHQFAKTSLTQLSNSENPVVRQYARKALEDRLNTLAAHSEQLSRAVVDSDSQ